MTDDQKRTKKPKMKKKPEVVAFPIWLGARCTDEKDLSQFLSLMGLERGFTSSIIHALPDVELRQKQGREYQIGVNNLFESVKLIVKMANVKIAFFFIVTAGVAESDWFQELRKKIRGLAEGNFYYTIVIGGCFEGRVDVENNPYHPNELRAHQLDAIRLYFDDDAPTACMRRLMEVMNRFMGVDLPGQKFPNYNDVERCQLEWHINRENFNSFGKKEGTIPKYQIGSNGRPVFQVGKK